MIIRTSTRLTSKLLKDWQKLHRHSSYSHFFNSPIWFQACLRTFKYPGFLLVACYSGGDLVGLLPLVKGKKAGFPAFVSPGNQFYDRSSLLLKEPNPTVINALINRLKKIGSFSLSELPEQLKVLIIQTSPQLISLPCSTGSFIDLTADPFPKMDKEHRRRITNKIKKLGSDLILKVYGRHAIKQLPTLIAIENSSRKKALFKDILSDPLLIQLLNHLDSLDHDSVLVDILFYQGQPICYQMGFNHQQTHSGFTTAYNDKYRFLLPGKLSTYLLSQYLYKIGMHTIDMSRGENMFKKDLSSGFYQQYEVYYAHPIKLTYWRLIDFVKLSLTHSPRLYEITRYSKNLLFRKVLAI